ncbi:hypothetical protein G2W53_033850 [Senna tora]|uniref:Myb/SANT-like domain-containing protein n=1 Tax=Senna tora TaxID=362788 RepID=A0A834SZD8_9FABA|nr:hypothetical protein G2W53_033850 [Senna tora]
MVQAFLKQFKHSKIELTRESIQKVSQKIGESFREYAQRWKQIAIDVQPPITEQEAIKLLNVPTIHSTYSPSPLTLCIAIHPSISEPHMYTSNRVVNQAEGTRQKDAQHAKAYWEADWFPRIQLMNGGNGSRDALVRLMGCILRIRVPLENQGNYHNRKGEFTTYVLEVCSRDGQFVYVLSGWEGSAVDVRVLKDAIERDDGLKVPRGELFGNFSLLHTLLPTDNALDPVENQQVFQETPMEDADPITTIEPSDDWSAWRDRLAADIYILVNKLSLWTVIRSPAAQQRARRSIISGRVQRMNSWFKACFPLWTILSTMNGTFKRKHLGKLEEMMEAKAPSCGLKATPHIQGRIRTLKSNWQIVYNMVNHIRASTSGFGWNDERKCVVADEHLWEEYLKRDGRYCRLSPSSVQQCQDPEFEPHTDHNVPFGPHIGEDMEFSERPRVEGGTEASSRSRKRRRRSSNKEEFKEAMREMTENMGKMFTSATRELVNSIAVARNMASDAVAEAVMFINGLTVEERQVVHIKIACSPILWCMFNEVPEDERADWIH